MAGQSSSAAYLDSITSQRDDSTATTHWPDIPPTPPPKSPGRTFGFAAKPSFSSLVSIRQNSASGLLRLRRPSETQPNLDISEGARRSIDDGDSSRTLINSSSSMTSGNGSSETRRSKSSILSLLKKRPSRPSLRNDSTEAEHPSLRPPVPELPDSLFVASNGTSLPPTLKKDKRSRKKSLTSTKKGIQAVNEAAHQYQLDTDLDKMEGIVDFTRASSGATAVVGSASVDHSASFESSINWQDNALTRAQHYPTPSSSSPPSFINPFSSSRRDKSSKSHLTRTVSPTTIIAPVVVPTLLSTGEKDKEGGGPGSPTWEAPQSWAVAPKAEEDADLSSSDESAMGTAQYGASRSKGKGAGESQKPSPALPHQVPSAVASSSTLEPARSSDKKSKSRKRSQPSSSRPSKPYIVRVYRANSCYHVVSIEFSTTVADLSPALSRKLLSKDERVIQHRLYLQERGRERVLAPNERPADIVRRRLEQAGYDAIDGLEMLAVNGLDFLFKFVYKSELLGPSEEDVEIKSDKVTNIDLTGRGLRTIPVSLYNHASTIMVLKLSRNPMIEIPLDFIQSCVSLCELKLSAMSMKRVPSSIRYSVNLIRLDLSSNRIGDLDDAFLDGIPRLGTLFVHNNKLEKLPWYFARMQHLTKLNISNNKFREVPNIITKIATLAELDLSFNLITDIPDELSELKNLRKLVVVGNMITRFPPEFAELIKLEELYCQQNLLECVSVASSLPNLRILFADNNALNAIALPLGPNLLLANVSHNGITHITPTLGTEIADHVHLLTKLDISHANLSSFDELGQLPYLRTLIMDDNAFYQLPGTLCTLVNLEAFSCADNKLESIPANIGNLTRLVTLDVHNNCITELPRSLWHCKKLANLNLTSNALENWLEPPLMAAPGECAEGRKMSTDSMGGQVLPPLARSLRRLFLGENRLTDDAIRPLRVFRELILLNLSFNLLQDLPSSFFRHMTKLEEVYLSGNKLTCVPTEDFGSLQNLTTLFLNGNKLQTLPRELGDLKKLIKLDVGSNVLKYNINNHEFDWNWNANPKLKYLNLSGNNRLQIKSDTNRNSLYRSSRDIPRSGFTDLTDLRVLGLIDVTITATGKDTTVDIPDENEDRRVRTSLSTVNGMAYGIADLLGKSNYLTMLDLVQEFPQRKGEAIFAMFGRSEPPYGLAPGISPNKMAKYLQEQIPKWLVEQLDALNPKAGEAVPDALRRTFLKLNQELHDTIFSSKNRKMSQVSASTGVRMGPTIDSATSTTGAASALLYFKDKTLYVANVGDSLAVMSRQGVAHHVSRKHDPFDRAETTRIRSAEGWISPCGLVNDEVNVSRSFGYYNLHSIINARPDISILELTEEDEFVIVANHCLWDYVSYQTAVDIVRSVSWPPEPMLAAQKLRDCATSYGATGSTMIMVIRVSDLFGSQPVEDVFCDSTRGRPRLPLNTPGTQEDEIPPPVGHIALAFTDIRNSTHLWEVNPGMPTAMRVHNSLLRRELRACGGYEVKTEGDAFMCSFRDALSAAWWCLTVQEKLLYEDWPLEILECEDGKPVFDSEGRLIARGLSVRMGIHIGRPVCEPDPVTQRMDYFGPMVNRCARINGSAAGGQIMISADVERVIQSNVLQPTDSSPELSPQLQEAVEGIRKTAVVVIPVGEFKLKGLELPEVLSVIYPGNLVGRHMTEEPSELTVSGSRVQFSIPQMWELGILCLRLEALANGRVFRPLRKGSLPSTTESDPGNNPPDSIYTESDPSLLLPRMNDRSSDTDLMFVLDSLSIRIQNALAAITNRRSAAPPTMSKRVFLDALSSEGELDEDTIKYIASIIQAM